MGRAFSNQILKQSKNNTKKMKLRRCEKIHCFWGTGALFMTYGHFLSPLLIELASRNNRIYVEGKYFRGFLVENSKSHSSSNFFCNFCLIVYQHETVIINEEKISRFFNICIKKN